MAEVGKDYLEGSGEYIFKACRGGLFKEERYKALNIFKLIDPEVGEKVMTLAERFKAEGEQKGYSRVNNAAGKTSVLLLLRRC